MEAQNTRRGKPYIHRKRQPIEAAVAVSVANWTPKPTSLLQLSAGQIGGTCILQQYFCGSCPSVSLYRSGKLCHGSWFPRLGDRLQRSIRAVRVALSAVWTYLRGLPVYVFPSGGRVSAQKSDLPCSYSVPLRSLDCLNRAGFSAQTSDFNYLAALRSNREASFQSNSGALGDAFSSRVASSGGQKSIPETAILPAPDAYWPAFAAYLRI